MRRAGAEDVSALANVAWVLTLSAPPSEPPLPESTAQRLIVNIATQFCTLPRPGAGQSTSGTLISVPSSKMIIATSNLLLSLSKSVFQNFLSLSMN